MSTIFLILLNMLWVFISIGCIKRTIKVSKRLDNIKETADDALKGEVEEDSALLFIALEANLNLEGREYD